MTRRRSASIALLLGGVLVGGGCGKSAPPSVARSSVSPEAAGVAAASAHPIHSECDQGATAGSTLASAKAPRLQVSPAAIDFAPGDQGVQLIARAQGSHGGWRDLTELYLRGRPTLRRGGRERNEHAP